MTIGAVITITVVFAFAVVFIGERLIWPSERKPCGRCGLHFRERSVRDIVYAGQRMFCCPGCWMRIEETKDKEFQGIYRP